MIVPTGDDPLNIGASDRLNDTLRLRKVFLSFQDGFGQRIAQLQITTHVQNRGIGIGAVPYLRMRRYVAYSI